uniref:Uncharacterized protein n=1 Tax=Arundo donax TaxID=35708 RepID=A0A0A9FN26_ARUDO
MLYAYIRTKHLSMQPNFSVLHYFVLSFFKSKPM